MRILLYAAVGAARSLAYSTRAVLGGCALASHSDAQYMYF
jgi:hypothetical protein